MQNKKPLIVIVSGVIVLVGFLLITLVIPRFFSGGGPTTAKFQAVPGTPNQGDIVRNPEGALDLTLAPNQGDIVRNPEGALDLTLAPNQGDIAWNPEGALYLTLAPKNGGTMGIYKYDIGTNNLAPLYAPEGKTFITGKFQTEGTQGLLASEYISASVFQIVRFNPDTQVMTTLTDTKTSVKRHPSWSAPYEALVYGGKSFRVKILGEPNEWNVYMTGKDGKEKKVADGALPVLTPDGKSVVVLQNDGLHKVALQDSTTEKIWGLDSGKAWFIQQFSISANGRYLAWTHPHEKKIYVMEVSSWTPFKGQLMHIINTNAFWPVFSPNSEYLAFQEVDWTDPPSKPRIVISSLTSLERRTLHSLDNFDQMLMFITDWK